VNALPARDQPSDAMKARFALVALLTLAATGCGASAPLVTVDKLLAQCEAFKGKPVQLAGYLGVCVHYECDLAADETHWRAYASAFNAAHRGQLPERREAWSRAFAVPLIGVGGNKTLDAKAATLQYSYVIISGTIAKDSCDGRGGTDRTSGVDPTNIRAWTRSEGAPATTK